MKLSSELGLDSRQIKFWFQNRRTQTKAQHERSDNSTLRLENDKIRTENIAMKLSLKKAICIVCGPSCAQDSFYDEQKLRLENARLKDELDRVSNMTSSLLGRPTTQLPPIQPLTLSSLQSALRGFEMKMDKPLTIDFALNALKEVIWMSQTNEPLWIKSENGDKEFLSIKAYNAMFPRSFKQFMKPGMRTEASRNCQQVLMDASTLVDMFLDIGKWMELFPTIVSKARILDIINTGVDGSNSGALVLMNAEVRALTPAVPTREFYFLRYCQQIDHNIWGIADVSVDLSRNYQYTSTLMPQKLPSGCLIQESQNGYSEVSWIEHVAIEDKHPIDMQYQGIVYNVEAFGALRWLATLQRMSQRFDCFFGASSTGIQGEGKRSIMKLSQKMINHFCASLSGSDAKKWTPISGADDPGVRLSILRSKDLGQPNGVILNAVTSLWLPIPCEQLFNFLKSEQTRSQWDVLPRKSPMQEIACIQNSPYPGNCISLLQALNDSENNMLLLQESCIDASGSLLVFASVGPDIMNMAIAGGIDLSCIPLLPSGFIILPDGEPNSMEAPSSSNHMGSSMGSIMTVAFQVLISSIPSSIVDRESVTAISNTVSTTVQQIKIAFNLPTN